MYSIFHIVQISCRLHDYYRVFQAVSVALYKWVQLVQVRAKEATLKVICISFYYMIQEIVKVVSIKVGKKKLIAQMANLNVQLILRGLQ